jgi:hypothetical protein
MEARALYEELYPSLDGTDSDDASFIDDLLARGPAHVLRLAFIYANLDAADVIRPEHIRAALACWNYYADYVRLTFHEVALRRTAVEVVEVMEVTSPRVLRGAALALGLTAFLRTLVGAGGAPMWEGMTQELQEAVEPLTLPVSVAPALASVRPYTPVSAGIRPAFTALTKVA